MTIRQQDIKLLWGRSGSRCALCKNELSFDPEHAREAVPLGEQAHIVAREENGPRGHSILSAEERDHYSNLILLCPTDHKKVDKAPEDYPVEKLQLIKADHESWVAASLAIARSNQDAANEVYAHLVDLAVQDLRLHEWSQWASKAVFVNPHWTLRAIDGVRNFDLAVSRAVWPGKIPELERAVKTLANVLYNAMQTFLEHADLKDDYFEGVKYYKQLERWDTEEYNRLGREWEAWLRRCQGLVFESTRAANWFADCVRRFLNPLFFVTNGKFFVSGSIPSDIPEDYFVVEYSTEERSRLPSGLAERLSEYRVLLPFELED